MEILLFEEIWENIKLYHIGHKTGWNFFIKIRSSKENLKTPQPGKFSGPTKNGNSVIQGNSKIFQSNNIHRLAKMENSVI